MSRSHAAHRQAIKKKDPHYFKGEANKRVQELLKRKYINKKQDDSVKIPEGIEFVEEFK